MTIRHIRIHGFTLIEMSIVLVVIGLLVGGVLVGIDLVRAAEVRAQISQIEKYNQAANTFRGKYGYLPGDLLYSAASQFGFTVGPNCTGEQGGRDGNGLLDGLSGSFTLYQDEGETALFWQDLTSSALATPLIEGQFPNSGAALPVCGWGGNAVVLSGTGVGAYFPPAKIGRNNYIYVYETNGANWFGVSAITAINVSGVMTSTANIPVIQAYDIDKKIDDGFPTTGRVVAVDLNGSPSTPNNAPHTTTSGGTSLSCYDTTTGTYSITYNGGANANCALSFEFQ